METQGQSLKEMKPASSKLNVKSNLNKNNTLYICTLNVKTLRTEERMVELKEALSKIKWDVIGIAEVRRLGQNIFEHIDGNIFSYIGTEKG